MSALYASDPLVSSYNSISTSDPPNNSHTSSGNSLTKGYSSSASEIQNMLITLFRHNNSGANGLLLFDRSQLCIVSGRFAFSLHVHLTVLTSQGNLKDACVFAAIATLRQVSLPALQIDAQQNTVYLIQNDASTSSSKSSSSILKPSAPLIVTPVVPVTIGLLSNPKSNGQFYMLLDPNSAEEVVMDGCVTVVLHPPTDQIYYLSASTSTSGIAAAGLIQQDIFQGALPLAKDQAKRLYAYLC